MSIYVFGPCTSLLSVCLLYERAVKKTRKQIRMVDPFITVIFFFKCCLCCLENKRIKTHFKNLKMSRELPLFFKAITVEQLRKSHYPLNWIPQSLSNLRSCYHVRIPYKITLKPYITVIKINRSSPAAGETPNHFLNKTSMGKISTHFGVFPPFFLESRLFISFEKSYMKMEFPVGETFYIFILQAAMFKTVSHYFNVLTNQDKYFSSNVF